MRKEELLSPEHPLGQRIREIPRILTKDRRNLLPAQALSLRKLFSREEMDKRHIDDAILKKIAKNVLQILIALSQRDITPGLIGTENLYVDLSDSAFPVYLCDPERFQLEQEEQEYDWYPEDERLFGDQMLFDRARQLLADNRLITRIMIGAARGNLKFPVKKSDRDYAHLFYRILPETWKEHMENNIPFSYEEIFRDNLEKKGLCENLRKEKECFCLYLLLRTERSDCLGISRGLDMVMEEVEEDAQGENICLKQAFVYGDDTVLVKDFEQYVPGFRLCFDTKAKAVSAGEEMIVAASLMNLLPAGDDAPERSIHVILDGKISNDAMFDCGFQKFQELTEKGVLFFVHTQGDTSCEAVNRLRTLEKNG